MEKKTKEVEEKKTREDNDKAVEATIREIRNYYNDKGIIMKMGESPEKDVRVINSGSLLLDAALGVGGYPKGRIIEIYGPESSGKTTLALEAIAQAQEAGGRCAFIDAEHAIDPEYAKTLGVDIDSLILSQPDYGEQALEIVDMLAKSNAIDLIVVDSVAALVPKAELEGTFEDSSVGLQARLMSKALRKLAGILSKTSCTVIFINQLREKVGVMYGNPETTTGGRALKFYATIRIEIRRGEQIKEGDKYVGNIVVSHDNELAQLAVDYAIVEKSGSWFSYQGERLGQGIASVYEFFNANPDKKEEVENLVKERLSGKKKES